MRDPLLSDEDETTGWPTTWRPFTVHVRPRGDVLELSARGPLDAWTSGALLRDLAAAYEPSYSEIRIDIAEVTNVDRAAVVGLARCREFAAAKGARFTLTQPGPVLHGVLIDGRRDGVDGPATLTET